MEREEKGAALFFSLCNNETTLDLRAIRKNVISSPPDLLVPFSF